MKPREIRPNVYLVGAVDWDRRLFDALIPLPHGTSYNAYLVRGSEKIALLDTVDPCTGETSRRSWPSSRRIDYIDPPPRRAGPLRQSRRSCSSSTRRPWS